VIESQSWEDMNGSVCCTMYDLSGWSWLKRKQLDADDERLDAPANAASGSWQFLDSSENITSSVLEHNFNRLSM
jgi:hypothetical protein